jgi:hypothetical protein
MQILFHPDAQEELNRAINHYKSSEPSLGYQYAIEIFAAVERIKAIPGMWTILDDQVLILAVMPLQRQPGYWRYRS